MTQTPDEPQNLVAPAETLASEPPITEPPITEPLAPEPIPIPAPNYVFAPTLAGSENSGASASPAVKKAIIAGVLSGLTRWRTWIFCSFRSWKRTFAFDFLTGNKW